MNYFLFIFIYLSLALIIVKTHSQKSRLLQQYTIGSQRSPYLSQFCSQVDRNKLYEKYSQLQQIPYESSLTRFFTLDKYFQDYVEHSLICFLTLISMSVKGYMLFIVLPLIGIGLLLVAGIICYVLIFCPFECCLRKKLIYSEYQQIYPVFLLSIFGLTAVGCCVAVLLSDYKLYSGYQESTCGSVMIFDGMLFGNKKKDGSSFFSGTKTIEEQFNKINQQSSYIYGNLSSISSKSSEISNTLDYIESCKKNISMIPNSNKSNIVLKYNTPLKQSTSNSTITSIFPAILGSYSDGQSLIGVSYNSLDTIYTRVKNISDTVHSFLETKNQTTNATSQIMKSMNQFSSNLDVSLLSLNDMITRYSFSKLQFAETVIYGPIILLVLLLLVCQVFFMGYKKMCCRHLIYIISFFIFFTAIALFALSLFFGFAAPIAYSGTSYLNNTLKNKSSLVQLLQKFGNPVSVGDAFSTCLTGNGQILAAASTPQTSTYFNLLRNMMNNLSAFDSNGMSATLNNNYQNLQSNLKAYSSSNILDITDTTTLQQFIYVSKPINYGCKEGNFQTDSWIPNTVQKGVQVACQTQFRIYADSSTCLSNNQFIGAFNGCTGCMSTASLLYQLKSSASVYDYLGRRYKDCPKFNNDLANIWANYYLVKMNVLAPIISRAEAIRPSIDQLQNKLNTNLGTLVNNTVTQLYLSAESVLNPKIGLMGGLNCGVIADDLAIFVTSLYKNTFSYCFHHMIFLSAISWSLVFVVWCNTCVLFRKKKDILNAINFPDDSRIARAEAIQPAPLTDNRLFQLQL